MVVGSHRLRLLQDGAQAFPAMLEAIAHARSTLCLETYILRDDHVGQTFACALAERARAGVEVNLLYDAWGSSVSSEYVEGLREAGARVVAFRPVLHALQNRKLLRHVVRRNHRKSLIVDSQIAFTGGINLCDDYAPRDLGGALPWRDTHLALEGPAAMELQYYFLRTWKKAKGPALDEPLYSLASRRPDPRVRVITSDVHRGRAGIRDAYRAAIKKATRRIWITNAYFLPSLGFLHALSEAAKRGVDVRIMVPGTTDVPAVLHASRSIYGRLLEAGARLYEWKGRVLHAKTAVIDGYWSTVGSSNLDMQSLRQNLEANALVEDERFGLAMEAMFLSDVPHCEEVTASRWEKRPPWERAASWAAYLFRDWL
ncbi:cardiolipin synthase ClsB [Polyangium spumosum]|uniref:Cardiolipin synthase ClsB n=2 Tax=Polyangium spumosum TaxID=889282 RepID=A0A6N7PTL1_9BACT|nr:cardiolipin synthase ClsB [Polyangium spumosum]